MKPALALACASLALCTTAHAEWTLDAEAGLSYDDNLSNAFEADDRKADESLTAAFTGGFYRHLGDNTGISMGVVVDSEAYLRYSGLTNIGGGVRAQARQKMGLGTQAPWAALAARAIYRNYHYDYLDGWQYDVSATLGKQFTDRWSVRASMSYDRYEAEDLQPPVLPGISTAAYDTSGWTIALHAAFSMTEADTLSAAYSYRSGSITSVTPPELEILEYSDAIARDPVFGGTTPLIAYRIDAKTDTLSLAWSRALGTRTAFSVAYSYRRSTTDTEFDEYYSNMLAIALGHSW
jgi:hypothetical protein